MEFLESGGLECELILMGRWGSALDGRPGTWFRIPMLSAVVTGVGWWSQGLGVFCKTHIHIQSHSVLAANCTSIQAVPEKDECELFS